MAELFVTKESIEFAKNILTQFLRDSSYAGSMEDGTGLYDIVIKPSALLYTLFKQNTEKTYAYLSLDKAKEAKSSLSDDDYDAAVDGILSNWFIKRNGGRPTYGYVRLWFSKIPELISYKKGAIVAQCGEVNLSACANCAYGTDRYSSVVNTVNRRTEYYIDVPVQSVENTSVLITTDSSVTANPQDIYYLNATIPADFTPGMDREDSDSLIARSEKAITTRELITDRAISTVLTSNFSDIQRIYVAGHGDPEMLRDVIYFNGVGVHVGNMADIWVATSLVKATQTFTMLQNGQVDLSKVSMPYFCHMLGVSDANGNPVAFSLEVDEQQWLIPGTLPKRFVATAAEGSEVTVSWLTSTTPGQIADFIRAQQQRVSNYDPRTKAMVPVILNIGLQVTASQASKTLTKSIQDVILTYIKGLVASGNIWVESEMVSRVHENLSDVKKLALPTTCTATLFDPKSSSFKTASIQNAFSLDAFDSTISKQLTDNTIQLYSSRDNIAVTYQK